MKLYFDCTSGISSDMILKALVEMGGDAVWMEQLELPDEGDAHHFHRSHKEVKEILQGSYIFEPVREIALRIYQTIAEAEAKVHESDVENVHFHEVGRNQAIKNIVGIASALNSLLVKEIYCSEIHDGTGTIECSHGTIPVPVPAVQALMESCDYKFVTEDINMELVTPSGLAAMIGMGAQYVPEMPQGILLMQVVSKGTRDTGKEGMKVSLIA